MLLLALLYIAASIIVTTLICRALPVRENTSRSVRRYLDKRTAGSGADGNRFIINSKGE